MTTSIEQHFEIFPLPNFEDINYWNEKKNFSFFSFQIKIDDNLSQLACTNCLDKLNTCINIINSFKEAQLQLQIGIN